MIARARSLPCRQESMDTPSQPQTAVNTLTCRELHTDQEIRDTFPLMSALRDRIRRDTFLAEVRRQQLQGYELIGAFEGARLVALAGIRRSHTLSRGEHLFVDDLVTATDARGRGHATELLRWLADRAAAEGTPRLYLDSRDTARGFYTKLGFRFLTSIPCWIDVEQMMALDGSERAR
jgi:ribosomal protein S18 acetylase RimI-like enzyme